MPGVMCCCQLWIWTRFCCHRLRSRQHQSSQRRRCKQRSKAPGRSCSLGTLRCCSARDRQLPQPLSSSPVCSSSRSTIHSTVRCIQLCSSITTTSNNSSSSSSSRGCIHIRSMDNIPQYWVGSRQQQPSRSSWRRSRLAPGPRAASSGSSTSTSSTSSSRRRSSCRQCTCNRAARRRRTSCSLPAAQGALRPAWQCQVGAMHRLSQRHAREGSAIGARKAHHGHKLRRHA
jgi:hypothetical protein